MIWIFATISPASEPDVQSWIEGQIGYIQQFSIPEIIYIEIEEFEPSHFDQSEIEEIRRRSSSLDQEHLEYLERVYANGGETRRFRIWYKDDRHWRVCTDSPFKEEKNRFKDAANNGDISWVLSPSTLHLIDPDNITRDNKSISTAIFLKMITIPLGPMTCGLIPEIGDQYNFIKIENQDANGGSLILSTHSESVPLVRVRFKRSSITSSPFTILRLEGISESIDPDRPAIGLNSEFENWEQTDHFARPVAHRYTVFSHDNPFRIYTITSLKRLSEPLDKLLKTPHMLHEDVIRGEPTFLSLVDHTSNTHSYLDPDTGDPLLTEPIRDPQESPSIRPYATIAAVGAVVFVIAFYMKAKGD